MYLRASAYVSGYDHNTAEEKRRYKRILSMFGLAPDICTDVPSAIVNVTVAYWRKANAIHKWFVDNCQDGKDECQESYVERQQLIELRDLCKKVLKEPESAKDLLPPQDGFFFGSTDIDKYYMADLKLTVQQLDRILKNKSLEGFEFIYHSSW